MDWRIMSKLLIADTPFLRQGCRTAGIVYHFSMDSARRFAPGNKVGKILKMILQKHGQCGILNAPKGMILPKVTPKKVPPWEMVPLLGGLFAWDVLTARNRAGQATCRHSSYLRLLRPTQQYQWYCPSGEHLLSPLRVKSGRDSIP